jgi:type IV pilus assembly protein PilB
LRDSKLLKVIKDKKLLTEDKLRKALAYKKKLGAETKLADVMLKLGFINEKQVSELVAESESIHVIDLTKHSVDFNALDKLPRKLLEKNTIVPLADEKGKILLAMAEPIDLETVDEIQFMTNCLVETVLAPRNDITKAIEEAYSLSTHERKARAREVAHITPVAPKPLPQSPYLAEVLTEILIERGLVTKEEIIARLKARDL